MLLTGRGSSPGLSLDGLDDDLTRMAVLKARELSLSVAGTGTDHRDLGRHGGQECVGGAIGGPVVANDVHVHVESRAIAVAGEQQADLVGAAGRVGGFGITGDEDAANVDREGVVVLITAAATCRQNPDVGLNSLRVRTRLQSCHRDYIRPTGELVFPRPRRCESDAGTGVLPCERCRPPRRVAAS
jgi:hypothetical protein